MSEIANECPVQPRFDNIVVLEDKDPDEARTSEGGVILTDYHRPPTQFGIVQAVGPGKLVEREDGSTYYKTMPFRVGLRVVFTTHSGEGININGTRWLIVKEKDVVGVILPPHEDFYTAQPDHVLVRPETPTGMTASGILLTMSDRVPKFKGKILQIGSAVTDFYPGETVIFRQHAGTTIPDPNDETGMGVLYIFKQTQLRAVLKVDQEAAHAS